MCLTSKDGKRFIAERDIECYKLLDKDLKPPYQPKFQYKLGEVVSDDKEERISEHFNVHLVEAGFLHSYQTHRRAYETTRYSLELRTKYSVYKAVIPKGSEYMVGMLGDYCSKQLKIIEKLE